MHFHFLLQNVHHSLNDCPLRQVFCHPFLYLWSWFSFIVQFIVSLRHHALFLCHCKRPLGFYFPLPFCSFPHFCTLWNKLVWEVLFFSVLQRVCVCVCRWGVWGPKLVHRASAVSVSGIWRTSTMNMTEGFQLFFCPNGEGNNLCEWLFGYREAILDLDSCLWGCSGKGAAGILSC